MRGEATVSTSLTGAEEEVSDDDVAVGGSEANEALFTRSSASRRFWATTASTVGRSLSEN